MADTRLALLPLTGAGDATCNHCEWRTLNHCELHGFLDMHKGPFTRQETCLASERAAKRLLAVEEAADYAVSLLEQTRFMALGGGPISAWAKTPEGKNHALIWDALQTLRAALKE